MTAGFFHPFDKTLNKNTSHTARQTWQVQNGFIGVCGGSFRKASRSQCFSAKLWGNPSVFSSDPAGFTEQQRRCWLIRPGIHTDNGKAGAVGVKEQADLGDL